MTIERGPSMEAFEKLDLGDVDAAVVLGDDICRDLGICCAEKGKVMFQVFKKLRELKSKEALAANSADEIINAVQEVFCPQGLGSTDKGGKGGDKNG